jgi:hypothetical protein
MALKIIAHETANPRLSNTVPVKEFVLNLYVDRITLMRAPVRLVHCGGPMAGRGGGHSPSLDATDDES